MNKTNKNRAKTARKKPISVRNEHFLVDDQGAFATLKENLWFSEPFYGFSSLLNTKKKHLKRGAFSLGDDQGLEAG